MDILGKAIFDYWKLIVQRLKKVKAILKGLLRGPFPYFGVIAIILILMTTFFSYPKKKTSFVSIPLLDLGSSNRLPFVESTILTRESPPLSFFQKNSLAAVSPLVQITSQVLGALTGSSYEEDSKEIIEYIVEEGDNLWTISKKFEISLETILWANDLNKNSLIQPGQKLIILPVSGLIHHVKKGETISEIAKTYKAELEDVIAFNDLSPEGDIFVGDILIIPNGVMPPPIRYAPPQVPVAEGYFICPILPPCRLTQGLHWYNAVDMSHGKCGDPIFAAAAGTVLKVKLTSSTSRWAFGGLGNHLTILHPNGVVTYYGHIANSLVSPGEQVSQGQMIALIGGARGTPGAGNSTGCHLHFGVSGARNPFR